MNVKLMKRINNDFNSNQINVTIEYSDKVNEIEDFIQYINNYNLNSSRKIIVSKNYELLEIDTKDIIIFYTNNKNSFCRTKGNEYRIKSKLYEIEKMNLDFIRISKSCIVNVNHVESFDISESGKIIVKLDDNSKEIVSRRKVKDVMNYLEERSV